LIIYSLNLTDLFTLFKVFVEQLGSIEKENNYKHHVP